jgi:hypothetical protein
MALCLEGGYILDKEKDALMFCNECNWEEETVGLPHGVCPRCGLINIGCKSIKTNDSKKDL